MSSPEPSPIVEEVLRFEDLPPARWRAAAPLVRWSDGAKGEALR
jgi:hypothetical protein